MKRTIFNFSDAIRNCYRSQGCALVKHRGSDTRDTVRNRDFCQSGAAGKRTVSNARDALRNHDFCQSGAAGKHTVSDNRDTVRNCNRGHSGAVFKGIFSNAGDTVRDRNRYQIIIIKSIIPDTSNAVFDHDIFDAFPLVIPRHRIAASPVRHLPRAGDRQCSRIIERPCEILAAGAGIDSLRRKNRIFRRIQRGEQVPAETECDRSRRCKCCQTMFHNSTSFSLTVRADLPMFSDFRRSCSPCSKSGYTAHRLRRPCRRRPHLPH